MVKVKGQRLKLKEILTRPRFSGSRTMPRLSMRNGEGGWKGEWMRTERIGRLEGDKVRKNKGLMILDYVRLDSLDSWIFSPIS